jgi:hypothetical protein
VKTIGVPFEFLGGYEKLSPAFPNHSKASFPGEKPHSSSPTFSKFHWKNQRLEYFETIFAQPYSSNQISTQSLTLKKTG